MVVVGDDRASCLFLLGQLLNRSRKVLEQVSRLCNLLLGEVLSQRPCKVIGLGSIETRLLRVKVASGETNVEVAPEGAIVLDSGGNGKRRLNGSLVGLVAEVKILLLQDDILVGGLGDRDGVERLRQGHDDVDVAVLRPDGRNVLGERTIRGALVELLGAKLKRRDALCVAGDLDDLARLGVVDGDGSLVLLGGVVESHVEAKVDGAAEEELVEVESLCVTIAISLLSVVEVS